MKHFVIHLRSFASQFHEKEAVRGVPWIGLYTDSLSKAVFVMSAVALPPLLILIVSLRGWQRWSVLVPGILAFVVAIVLSLNTLSAIRKIWGILGSRAEGE